MFVNNLLQSCHQRAFLFVHDVSYDCRWASWYPHSTAWWQRNTYQKINYSNVVQQCPIVICADLRYSSLSSVYRCGLWFYIRDVQHMLLLQLLCTQYPTMYQPISYHQPGPNNLPSRLILTAHTNLNLTPNTSPNPKQLMKDSPKQLLQEYMSD